MTTLADVQSDFLSRLNRDDCSADLATAFINDSCRRLQRTVHLPSTERSQLVVAQGNMTAVIVPPDLLEVIDVFASPWPGGPAKALEKVSFRQLAASPNQAPPSCYARLGSVFEIRGAVLPGSSVLVVYYGQTGRLSAPSDTNDFTLTCPDVVVYGALSLAGDYFDHPGTQAFEARYQQLLSEVQVDLTRLENTGGPTVLSNPYYDWSSA